MRLLAVAVAVCMHTVCVVARRYGRAGGQGGPLRGRRGALGAQPPAARRASAADGSPSPAPRRFDFTSAVGKSDADKEILAQEQRNKVGHGCLRALWEGGWGRRGAACGACLQRRRIAPQQPAPRSLCPAPASSSAGRVQAAPDSEALPAAPREDRRGDLAARQDGGALRLPRWAGASGARRAAPAAGGAGAHASLRLPPAMARSLSHPTPPRPLPPPGHPLRWHDGQAATAEPAAARPHAQREGRRAAGLSTAGACYLAAWACLALRTLCPAPASLLSPTLQSQAYPHITQPPPHPTPPAHRTR